MLKCGECGNREAKVVNTNDITFIPEDENYDEKCARVIRCNICMVQGAKRAWDEQAQEYDVATKAQEYLRDSEGYIVTKMGDDPARRDWLRTTSIEVYRASGESDYNYPFIVRTSISNHLTPKQARAIAAALIEAANDVDEKNRDIRPQE